ncbi:MAG TPA: hypothetical protein VF884_14330 [Nitrososphaeraceae archaeon]
MNGFSVVRNVNQLTREKMLEEWKLLLKNIRNPIAAIFLDIALLNQILPVMRREFLILKLFNYLIKHIKW